MKKSDIFSKFNGIKAEYSRAVSEIKAVKYNSGYTESYKNEKIEEIRNNFYKIYKDKTNQALEMAEICIRDKKEGQRIVNVKKMSPDEKVYALNFYTSVIEKMTPKEIMNFMKKEENLNNEVYRECFLTKADVYKDKSDFKSGVFIDVKEILTQINGDNIPEVIEYNQIIKDIKNSESMLNTWNSLRINIEEGDMTTGEPLVESFNLQSKIRDQYTTWGTGINSNINTGDSQTGGFGFNFKPVRSQDQ